jgi:hypothetical protein
MEVYLENIYIFGTGTGREKLERVINKEKFNIVAYIDNDIKKQGLHINGIEIISPLQINKNAYRWIFIASEYSSEIIKQLNEIGILENILCIFKNYSLEEYINKFSEFLSEYGIELIKQNYKYYGNIDYVENINFEEKKFISRESAVVKKIYRTKKNYKIQYNLKENADKNVCVIYFSSNAIYYPDVQKEFEKNIIEKDKYEWLNISVQRAYKSIFVRDIYKQWYKDGINSDINSVNKLKKLLEKETHKYTEIICIGVSAGGYAAVLFGNMIKAKYVIAFSPQFNLNIHNSNIKNTIRLYNDLGNFIYTGSSIIFYFCPIGSDQDYKQYNVVKSCENIKSLLFDSNSHGIPINKSDLQNIINLKFDELLNLSKKLEGRIIDPNNISFYL